MNIKYVNKNNAQRAFNIFIQFIDSILYLIKYLPFLQLFQV